MRDKSIISLCLDCAWTVPGLCTELCPVVRADLSFIAKHGLA